MDTALWIVQGLLAFAFLAAGLMKLTQPMDVLSEKIGAWVEGKDQQVRMIGLLEFLGAVGVVLPMAINILPMLTPVAAMGLSLTMLGAIALHASRKEYKEMLPGIVILGLSIFVIYGRLELLIN